MVTANAPHGTAFPAHVRLRVYPVMRKSGMTERFLKQREAAEMLSVSVAWLRASECPKVLLPGNGPKGRPVVRYREKDLLA